jgi:signal peptidase I
MTVQDGVASRRDPLRRSLFSAAILSLIVPGFGQLYVGRARRAFVFMALYGLSSLVISLSLAGLLPRFWILAVAVAALLVVYLVALIDAVAEARKLEAYTPKACNRWYVYAGIIVVLLLAKALLWQATALFARGPGYYQIPSASMLPTLRPGETLLADTHYFNSHAPRRGAVVVFNRPQQPGVRAIMRIVALGGDRVAVLGGRAVVNGTPLSEPYADLGDPASFTNTTREWSVPQGAVFLLGDSRANSVDSRLYGPVPVSDLVGPVTDIVVSAQLSRVGRSVGTPPGSR